jgi:hypothetical protein
MPEPLAVPDAAAEASASEVPARGTGRRLVLATIAVAVIALVPLLATRPWYSPPPPTVEPATPSPSVVAPPAEPAAAPPPTPEPAEEAVAPARPAPPSALDAIALVDRFWQAYGARDADGVRALFAPDAAPTGPVLDVDPTGGGALVTPAPGIEAKPVGDRVAVRVPFLLTTHDDRGRPVRRQGVASLQVATRDGGPRIVALSAESGPVARR